MKVSLVMTSGGLGGIQQSLVPYALALRQLGCEVQVVVARGSEIVAELSAKGLGDALVMIKGRHRVFRSLLHAELQAALLRFSPDIVVGFAQKGFFEAERALRGSGIPVVTRVGTMRPEKMRRFTRPDGWLATTAEMKHVLAGFGFPAERIFLVPNFLAEPSLPRSAPGERAVPRVGSLGRFVQRKGYHDLVDAVLILRRRGVAVECEIAGDGKEKDALQRRIREAGATADIRLVGWLGNVEKLEFLTSLDLFVSPSLNEPFGFVYLDAMRTGTPIVTTPTVGARFIFASGEGAVLAPFGDPTALADAIADALADRARLAGLGEAGRTLYEERFSLAAGARNLGQALGQLVAMGPRTG
jgi:glycosyltransferase involved in cell wall biosynthesis